MVFVANSAETKIKYLIFTNEEYELYINHDFEIQMPEGVGK